MKKAITIFLISVAGLFILVFLLLNLPFSRRFATRQVNRVLQRKEIPLHVDSLQKVLPTSVEMMGVSISGPEGDTLIRAAHVSAEFRLLPLIRSKVILKDIYIHGARMALVMNNTTGKYSIEEAFLAKTDGDPEREQSTPKLRLYIRSAILEDARFRMSDSLTGIQMNYNVSDLGIRGFNILIPEHTIQTRSLDLNGATGELTLTARMAPGISQPGPSWKVDLQRTQLENIHFTFAYPEKEMWLHANLGRFSLVANEMNWTAHILDLDRIRLEQSELIIRSPEIQRAGTSSRSLPFLSADSTLRLKGISLDITNAEMKGEHTGLTLKALSAETDLGLAVKGLQGKLESGDGYTRMEILAETRRSRISLKGESGVNLNELLSRPWNPGHITLDIRESQLSPEDVAWFLPVMDSIPQALLLPRTPVRIAGQMELNGDVLDVPAFSLQQERRFRIKAEGRMEEPFTPERIRADLNATIWSNLGEAGLTGSLDLPADSFFLHSDFSGMSLEQLLELPLPGSVYGNGTVQGSGLAGDSLNSRFALMLDSFVYRGLPFSNIALEGIFRPGLLTGTISSGDPSLGGNVHASLNLGDTALWIRADGMLSANLGMLGLLDDSLSVESSLNGTLTLYTDSLSSGVHTTELKLIRPGQTIVLDSVTMLFETGPGDTKISTSAGGGFLDLDAEISTPFSRLDSLGEIFRDYLTGLKDSAGLLSDNRLARLPEISVRGKTSYHDAIRVLVGDTSFHFTNLEFTMDHHYRDQSLKSEIRGDDLVYGGISTGKLDALVSDSAGKLNLSLVADHTSLGFGPDYHWDLTGAYEDRNAHAALRIYDMDKQVVYRVDLEGIQDRQRIDVQFLSDQVILNRIPWEVASPGFLSLDLESNRIRPDFSLQSGESVLSLRTRDEQDSGQYRLSLSQVDLEKLWRPDLIPGKPAGRLSGTVDYKRSPEDSLRLETDIYILQAAYASIHYDSISLTGTLDLRGEGNLETELQVRMDSSSMEMQGVKQGENDLTLDAGFRRFPLRTIEPLVNKYISGLQGDFSGDFNIASSPQGPVYTGNVRLNGTGLKVNALNSRFTIPDQQLRIGDDKILFDKFRILDTLNNALTVNGTVYINPGKPPSASLEVSSDRLKLMSKDPDSQAPITGDIFLDSRFSIGGPLSKPNIDGKILLANGTEIYYQLLENLNTSESAQIVEFSDYTPPAADSGTVLDMHHAEFIKSSIETSVEIDPATLLNFRVSRRIYDLEMNIKGGGQVDYTLLDNNRSTLSGRYEIREGEAYLKLTGWPNKEFTITQGGYVRWDGRIDNPELKIEAMNRVTSSYINPVDGKRMDADFNVILEMSGYLSDLDVRFVVRTPDQYIMSVINTLSPEEQMQQAVSILLFETIDLPGFSSSSDYMTQQINQIVANQLNQLTQSTIKGFDISFGFDSYNQPIEGGAQKSKTNLTYEVRKSMLNERAQFELKGRVYDVNQQPGSSDISLHDISFEYRLDSAATRYLKVYNKQSYDDVFEGQVVKTGIGYTYRKRYESLSDIWRRKKRKKNP